MVKGKTKDPYVPVFPGGYVDGRFYNDQESYNFATKRYEEKLAKKKVIQAEMSILKGEINEALKEKKVIDKEMEAYTSEKVRELACIIEDYETQIQRLELAVDLCKKSLRINRKEHNAEFKEKHPFPKLKILQDKHYQLERKLYKL